MQASPSPDIGSEPTGGGDFNYNPTTDRMKLAGQPPCIKYNAAFDSHAKMAQTGND